MPFQLSRGRLKILTGATATAFALGLACLALAWLTHDLRWGHTSVAVLILGLALNQRRLAGQIQRRTNQVIDFYAEGPPLLVVPGPRATEPTPEPSPEPEQAEGPPAEPRAD